jgi:hypothetical protein
MLPIPWTTSTVISESPTLCQVSRLDVPGVGQSMPVEDISTLRVELLAITERLIAEFDDTPSGRVIAVVALCRRQLDAAGVLGTGLTYATESMARTKMSKAA